jgi:hypothetical protein
VEGVSALHLDLALLYERIWVESERGIDACRIA